MDHIDLDAETLRKLERLAAARGETPADVMRDLVAVAAEPINDRSDRSRAKGALEAWLDEARAEWARAAAPPRRDARGLVNDLYDEHGLPR